MITDRDWKKLDEVMTLLSGTLVERLRPGLPRGVNLNLVRESIDGVLNHMTVHQIEMLMDYELRKRKSNDY